MKLRYIFLLFVLVALPIQVHAAAKVVAKPLEVSGWIPYWRTATGTADAIAHIDTFTEISPFGYTVKKDGSLFDAMKIASSSIIDLVTLARSKNIKIIPTVMWSDGDTIEAVLKNKQARASHIKAIVAMVKSNNFDGVDIDYEGKKATTRPYFSAFLKELYSSIGKKPLVVCTIESRTPLTDRFDKIPKDIEYANDLPTINKYCDRVRIMTYDQLRVDLRLNASAVLPYAPVADTKWVEKSIRLMMKDINKSKISIGVATYGYESEIMQTETGGYLYKTKWSFNPRYATDIANSLGIIPTRNEAGELSYVYNQTQLPAVITASTDPITVKATEVSGSFAPIANNLTSSSATATVATVPSVLRFIDWSDVSAIKDKVTLAKKLGVRGIAIFKIDGGEDQTLWNVLK
jgi:spore germination protein YaaH